jgi:ERCC4-type nuclease
MKKPPHVKAWNEDLKKALEIRYEKSIREASGSIHSWRNGIQDLVKERRDIWVDASGNVHGMPLTFKTQTVRDLCYAIVQGKQPIFPPGYQPMTAEEARYWTEEQNPFHHDPFLKRMKKGGGSYAILMAFHYSQKKTLTRTEICRLGQDYCTEPMETNFLQGTVHAGISSLSTLASHRLILTSREYQQGSIYSLTRDGERFIEALLEKFPQVDPHGLKMAEATPDQPPSRRESPTSSTRRKRSGTTRINRKEQDLLELLDWLKSAPCFAIKKFKMGTDRRCYLHTACDTIMTAIPGLQIKHRFQNFDEEQLKTMQVILEEKPAIDITSGVVTSFLKQTLPSPPAKRSLTLSKIMPKEKSMSSCGREKSALTKVKPRSFSDAWCDVDTSSDEDNFEHGPKTLTKPVTKVPVVLGKSLDGLWDSEDEEYEIKSNRNASPSSNKNKSIIMDLLDRNEVESDKDRKVHALPPKVSCQAHPPPTLAELLESTDDESQDEQKLHSKTSGSMQDFTVSVSKVKSSTDEELIDLDDSDDDDSSQEIAKAPPNPQSFARRNEIDLVTSHEKPPSREAIEIVKQNAEIIEIDDSDDDADALFEEAHQAIVFLSAPVSQDDADDVPTLSIFIDDRERNRDATPRELRIELTRHLTTGSVHEVWPPNVPAAIVEEATLKHGDYAFLVGSDMNSRQRLNIAVERKRISDIVSRSVKGDHWTQFTKMRDIFRHSIFLIEGDPKTAKGFTAYGHQSLEGRNPLMTIVEDEESLYCFLGRALLSHQCANFIQTKNEQGTHRAIGALGLMAASLKSVREDFTNASQSSINERTQLSDQLALAGVPWKLAQNIAREFGSTKQLALNYALCESDACSSALIYPVAMHTRLEGDSRTPEALSDFVYRSFVSQASRSTDLSTATIEKRHVNIVLSSQLVNIFPHPNDTAFFSLHQQELQNPLPTIIMETIAGSLRSPKLFIHVVSGDDFMKRIQASMKRFPKRFVDASKEVGAGIKSDCTTSNAPFRVKKDRKVVLLQGLSSALDSISRHAGYQQEIRAVSDLVIANLMLEHNVVVIQAIHKKREQLATIVQQLSLACFHYHLLTEERHLNYR